MCLPSSAWLRSRLLRMLRPPLAAAGRYLLDRAVFDALRRISPGQGGELQLTDAIALLIAEGHPVHVVVHHGTRHDLGNPGGFLRASLDHALSRTEYGPGSCESGSRNDWISRIRS